ncbi:MAG: GNAT family N-acetyltransferase [Bacteroidota bacterium]
MEIRLAEKKDLISILEILNYEIQYSTAVYYDQIRNQEYIEKWFEEKGLHGFPVYVAVENGLVLGYGTFGKYRPHDGFKYTVEHSIYISKETRGMGIGGQLMEKLIDSAKQLGFHTMIAGIDAENMKSCKFHEDFGFVEVGRQREVGFKFNSWLDLVFMQKML